MMDIQSITEACRILFNHWESIRMRTEDVWDDWNAKQGFLGWKISKSDDLKSMETVLHNLEDWLRQWVEEQPTTDKLYSECRYYIFDLFAKAYKYFSYGVDYKKKDGGLKKNISFHGYSLNLDLALNKYPELARKCFGPDYQAKGDK